MDIESKKITHLSADGLVSQDVKLLQAHVRPTQTPTFVRVIEDGGQVLRGCQSHGSRDVERGRPPGGWGWGADAASTRLSSSRCWPHIGSGGVSRNSRLPHLAAAPLGAVLHGVISATSPYMLNNSCDHVHNKCAICQLAKQLFDNFFGRYHIENVNCIISRVADFGAPPFYNLLYCC